MKIVKTFVKYWLFTNIDLMSNDVCNSGSHRRFPIYSVNLIGKSPPWCKWRNQAGTSTISIHMSSQTHMHARFSLICHMTQQNNRLESCLRRKVKCVKKALFIIVYKQTDTSSIMHMVKQQINYSFAFSLIFWDLKYWSVKLLGIRACAGLAITSFSYWPNRQGWPNR